MTNDTVEVSVLKITRARNDNKPNLVANARIKLNIFGVQQEIGGFSIWHGCDGVGITPLKINGEAMYRAEKKHCGQKSQMQ